jgi:hypothetical protein
MTQPHDEVISALLEVLAPKNGQLRLLNRLADPVIGSDTDDVYLFVPDLHFVSPEQQVRYGNYRFNHGESGLLFELLSRLVGLRRRWDAQGARDLVTVQLGDFFDLWRELGPTDPMGGISDEVQGGLRDVLYRGVHRGEPCLDAVMLLGNHDTQDGKPLPEIPFHLKAFNRSNSGRPFLFMTHGDAFDLFEILAPDPIQEFIVHLIGRMTPTNKYSIENWGKAAARVNRPPSAMQVAITKENHALDLAQGALVVKPGRPLPDRLVTEVGVGYAGRRFDDYYRALTHPNAANSSAADVRVVVAGHTHEAGMLLCRPPGARPLLLMDVGAWVEKCTYPLEEGGAKVTEPSAQLGVLHGNDARIYQIHFPS